ncbi:MAG: InlB B-repeat-containing protein [Bacilli bacterium]|nr:InlB B-repeat-containing protein [Bacilli bacterium]
MKKVILGIVFFLTTMFVVGCAPATPQASLTLKNNEVDMYEGDTYEIEAILKNASGEIIYTVIGGEDLVSLEGNVVTALVEGKAVVQVTVAGYPNLKKELTIDIMEKEHIHKHVVCPECGKCMADDCDGLEEEKCLGHDALVPSLTVEQTEIELKTIYDKVEIKAEVSNITANVVCEVIEGFEFVKTEGQVVMPASTASGTAKVRVSIEGYPEIYIDVVVIVDIVADEVSPVIELVEGASSTLKLNWNKEASREFLMNGLIASDNVDGDLTSEVKISHAIDNKAYGTYVVKYEVSDKSNNTATFERNVEVVWDYAVKFIGHQGSYYGVPNTEEAFLYAAEILKYQALETDVKQTKDGVFVCCHDDTFGGLTIANTNWADLKDVVVNSSRTSGYPSQYGEMPGNGKYSSKICTLERYLEICKEYGIYAVVELKGSPGISNSDQSRMPELMALIEQEGMLEQTIFLASAYNCLIWVKQNGYDYIPCQYLVDSFASETVFERCKTYGLDVSGCVTYGNGQTENTAEWVARYQDAGIKVSTYTFTQYSDYSDVQKWINIGVDFVTVDWQSMHKLTLPDNSDIVYHTVKFYDHENNLLKEAKVREGRTAASPLAPERKGYEFAGWSESIDNVISDMSVTALYDLVEYKITYDSNLYVISKSSWVTKEEFVSDFYNDLFSWLVANAAHLSSVTVENGSYKIYVNSTEYGSCTVSSAQDIRDLYVYTFERTFATMIYKPIEGANSYDYVPEIDNNYFLNSEPYRTKYIGCNEYFLKAMETAYPAYSYTYKQASNNRVQIFFRFHQWCNGSSISAFGNYPEKNIVKYLVGVEATMPTDNVVYTIEDEFVLSAPSASIEFLGWYLDREGTSEKVEKIGKGTTGDIILYAKWEEVVVPDVYSKINYVLDGGTNDENNPQEYLEGVSTMLYPASKVGYVFKGWSKEANSNSYMSSISELTSGEITLYANYDYEVYEIEYDLQGGEWGNKAEFTGTPVTSISTTLKDGFWAGAYADGIFLNHASSDPAATWSFRVGIGYSEQMGIYSVINIADSGASFDETNVEYVITISSSYKQYASTATFRSAVKIGQGVKVTGDLDSGAATIEFYDPSAISGATIENYVKEYTIASLPILLPTPKLEGKVFVGWSLSASSNEVFTSLPTGTMGNITLYAVFADK